MDQNCSNFRCKCKIVMIPFLLLFKIFTMYKIRYNISWITSFTLMERVLFSVVTVVTGVFFEKVVLV